MIRGARMRAGEADLWAFVLNCALTIGITSATVLAPASAEPASEPFSTPETATIEHFAWFTGCWSMALPNGHVEETWLAPAGGAMLGLSRTLRGGRMTQYEFLALRSVDGKLAYVAIPSRQRETVFPLVRYRRDVAIFENPAHDFPQRIVYRRTDTGITATVEGKAGGKLRSAEFIYTPCAR